MLPPPLEYRFTIDGASYLLVEWTRGGERRFRADYAASLVMQAPDLIRAMERPDLARDPLRASERVNALTRQLSVIVETLDGPDLYAEAVARECLREAPEIFWESRPNPEGQNGATLRIVTFERVPRRLWEQFRQGVEAFIGQIFPSVPATSEPAPAPGPGEPAAVAAAENLPAMLRGRAE